MSTRAQAKAKRDFLFIDESGDPGSFSPYYILGLLHVTDISLKELNIHLGALRYFGSVKRELKSSRVTKDQREQLLRIIGHCNQSTFVRASSIYVPKNEYQGVYLTDKPDQGADANRFQNFMMRRLLEHHFSISKPQSNEVEIIVDRFFTSEEGENRMRHYLRDNKRGLLPAFLHITQADSRYVELLQLADWIAGIVKERFFTHKDRDFEDVFLHLKTAKVTK
jgi:hypothetical protein